MDDVRFQLITGRTINQGRGVSAGKMGTAYRVATTQVELNPQDMIRLNLKEGDRVKLVSPAGQVSVKCKEGNVPPGLAFMAFGAAANQLIAIDTQATGMPESKGISVQLIPVRSEKD